MVAVPAGFEAHRRYVVGLMLGSFLGLRYRIEVDPTARAVSISGSDRCELTVGDHFFSMPENHWLTTAWLPAEPLQYWDATECLGTLPGIMGPLPLLFCKGEPWHEDQQGSIRLGIDVFGSAFFLLTRYEEAVGGRRDMYDRFPAGESLASREGFLERPVVNEFLELLWAAMSRLWPGLKRRLRTFRQLVTHDVDVPFLYRFLPWRAVCKQFEYCLRKRSFAEFSTTMEVKAGRLHLDPFNTFDWMMSKSEENSVQSHFYFMCGNQESPLDGRYSIGHPVIRGVFCRILDRGHAVGLHGSYFSAYREGYLRREIETLGRVCREYGGHSDDGGGRQHFLRWHPFVTPRLIEEARLAYDCTLGFADRIGFRCGTCYPFPLFDLERGKELEVEERPLVVMDVTLGRQYMNVGYGAVGYRALVDLKEKCRVLGGDFVLLWHNSSLDSPEKREFYEQALKA